MATLLATETQSSGDVLVLVYGLMLLGGVAAAMFALVRRVGQPRQSRQVRRLVRRVQRTWAALAVNLGLAFVDETTRGQVDALTGRPRRPRITPPAIHVSGDAYGVLARAMTLPGIGLEQYQRAAPHLANAWGCERVECSQTEPGSVLLRGLVSDPLVERWPVTLTGRVSERRWLLVVGRDRFGGVVPLGLTNLAGIKMAGAPGYGKTNLALSFWAQLAPRPEVQFVVFDGKTSTVQHGDWGDVLPRVALAVGDDPAEANAALHRLVALVKRRPGQLRAVHGTNRFWQIGPTLAAPLVVVLIDESHNYTDTAGLRGDAKQLVEDNQRLLRTLVKEGRGCGLLPIVMTQKQTGDAIPTSARDNLEVGLCFATTTIEAAAAALGPGIREDPDNCPTRLVDKHRYVGVCTATGLPGITGYTRLRAPEINPTDAARLAHDTRHLRAELDNGEDAGVHIEPAPPRRSGGGSARPYEGPQRRRRGGTSAKRARTDAVLAAFERAERG